MTPIPTPVAAWSRPIRPESRTKVPKLPPLPRLLTTVTLVSAGFASSACGPGAFPTAGNAFVSGGIEVGSVRSTEVISNLPELPTQGVFPGLPDNGSARSLDEMLAELPWSADAP